MLLAETGHFLLLVGRKGRQLESREADLDSLLQASLGEDIKMPKKFLISFFLSHPASQSRCCVTFFSPTLPGGTEVLVALLLDPRNCTRTLSCLSFLCSGRSCKGLCVILFRPCAPKRILEAKFSICAERKGNICLWTSAFASSESWRREALCRRKGPADFFLSLSCLCPLCLRLAVGKQVLHPCTISCQHRALEPSRGEGSLMPCYFLPCVLG